MLETTKTLEFIPESSTPKEIVKELKGLGRLSDDFDSINILVLLSEHKNEDVRHHSIKNLAKLSNEALLNHFHNLIKNESVSKNRREIASAIGRMRSPKAINTMLYLLKDRDPNVVLQAIRGLLVFKENTKVRKVLLNLKNHENELVQKIIEVEFYDKKIYQKNHPDFPCLLKDSIFHGDAIDILKKIEDEAVHLTFTSPPYYNARDYSTYKSYNKYLAFLKNVFSEVYRVTKEGRFFILNTSPIIIPRIGRKYSSRRYPIPYDLHKDLVDMGWEFIDDIVWVKPEPSAKNRVAGFEQHRNPLAYKPNCISECVMVYRKKSNKLIDWIYSQYSREIIEASKVEDGYETSNIWNIAPSHDKIHSAVFPLELCDRVIKYYSFKKDLILDPFAGSGSVGVSAVNNERSYCLIEKNSLYYKEINKKLKTNSDRLLCKSSPLLR